MTSRTYQGYIRADQSPVEEENELEEQDLESGRRSRGSSSGTSRAARAARNNETERNVLWDAGTSGTNALRPNIKEGDGDKREDSSDDEVPQSFIIETPTSRTNAALSKAVSSSKTKGKGKAKASGSTNPEAQQRGQPLYSVAGRRVPPAKPILPVSAQDANVNIPPRPSELDEEEHLAVPYTSAASNSGESNGNGGRRRHAGATMGGLDAYERALWNWVNVYNLDAFLLEVYYYYEGKGIYSIALARGLNLLTVGFVIGFSTFLLGCIDYSKLREGSATHLSQVIVDKCVSKFSGLTLLFFILFLAFYIWQIISFALDIYRLIDMYNFYTYLLKIPDADIQTISWSEVVRRIGSIREENPITALSSKNARGTNDTTTAKLDAHDIANRIMRQENYLIALFNKELLDLRVPLPKLLQRFVPEEKGKGKVLTEALEWNLRFCLMDYLFDHHGRVRKVFLKSKNRAALIEGLRRRFIFMGILNAIFAPFIVLYLIMYSFFRYFEEYRKDPSSIGGRRYTSYAKWKFREFNELPHFFTRRLDESYPVANIYIGQFPNEKMSLIMRFVSFVAGAFTAVLALASVLDPDLFKFEITPHSTVAFYLALFGGILTVARGMIPEENRVFDPELLMTEVITYTHYMPEEWKGHLHSKQASISFLRFGELFAMKVLIFVQELVSVILTPFVLWFSLPDCSPAIIDFFREFSVHVDGRGYVCSFAEFNFERHGNVKFGAPTRANDKKMISNEGKMEKSFLNFKAANPDWNPTDPSGSLYLSRMADLAGVGAAGSTLPFNARDPHSIANLYRRRHFANQPPHQPVPGPFQDHVHFVTSPPPVDVGLSSSTSIQLPGGEDGLGGKLFGERAQEYDWALKQSQNMATARRRGMGASILLGGSTNGLGAASVYSAARAADLAKTVLLEDSQADDKKKDEKKIGGGESEIMGDDSGMIGESGLGVGESYVDGAKRERMGYGDGQDGGQDEDEEFLEDGGVLGLLAQIYGRREGPVRGI
ncbi:APG9-domain-containing protein [Macrolepiota fuliginosa MF-IS2]|uniref:Autophagy-related protein 9 n=1 Tax=Macrolepiota fuliginosa MF-IS2 TaxID=1400762 RepID=A0A9P5XPK4_9AGAR|nr:APG9-domain-containing protein [Macrolepiota fuliginosa MF-IS2]